MLDLVDPFRAARRLLAERCQARLEECRQQALPGAANSAYVGENDPCALAATVARALWSSRNSPFCRDLFIRLAADLRSVFLVGDFRLARVAGELVL